MALEDVAGTDAATEVAPADQAAAAPAPESAPLTIAEGAKPSAPPPPADWPADWREKVAAGDPKAMEPLKTMGSPADLGKAYTELKKKMLESKRVPELPAKATDEQVAEYRKAAGIPETADKYNLDLGDGFVWAVSDKPALEEFAKFAHDANMPDRYMHTALAGLALHQRKVNEEYATKDKEFQRASEHQLLKEWGDEYDENANAAGMFANRRGLFDKLMNSRAPGGTVNGNDPEVLSFFAEIEKTLNPAATLLPASGGDSAKTVEEQWADALDVRRKDPDKYNTPEFQKKVMKLANAKALQEGHDRKRA